MGENKPHEYIGEGFKVTYDKGICIHSGVCVKTLPNVFDPKRKPWINISGASAAEIKSMIMTCPSAALRYVED